MDGGGWLACTYPASISRNWPIYGNCAILCEKQPSETVMSTHDNLASLLELTGADTPVHPASDIKSGWGRIVESAVRHGEVIVTHHRRPEVVVMDVAAYADLMRRAEANGPLRILQADFDKRFGGLRAVREENLFAVDATIMHRQGPRVLVAVESLCRQLDEVRQRSATRGGTHRTLPAKADTRR